MIHAVPGVPLHSSCQTLTIKVDVAIFVEVNVSKDLLQLALLHLLPQEGLHALLQLIHGDLPIAIAVKLWHNDRGTAEMNMLYEMLTVL